jgi:Asp-tRNA(Asn)/Glu-tRNA(Gln) amidotransferase B subunit
MQNSEMIAKKIKIIFKDKGNFKISRETFKKIGGRHQLRDVVINEIAEYLYDDDIFLTNLDSEFAFVRISTLTNKPEISWEDAKQLVRRKVKK